MRRVTSVAHQLINKPCDGPVLGQTLSRTLDLRAMLDQSQVRTLAGDAGRLPAMPRTYSELCRRLEDPNGSLDEISGWIEDDPALAACVLKIANSAFFSSFRSVGSIRQAVVLVGTDTLRNLVLTVEAFASFESLAPEMRGIVSEVHDHSVQVARVAARLHPPGPGRDHAFAAGLLHDIGKLVLVAGRPGAFEQLRRTSVERDAALHVEEREVLGVSHAELGAYLLFVWGLPYPIVEAVAWHHTPDQLGGGAIDPGTAVVVANALVHGFQQQGATTLEPAVEAFLVLRGLDSRLDEWRELTADLLGEAA